ncbi:putative tail protein [Brevundimonas phage vB_BpoS-Kikimora]|uniref:Tail protein n=1 Tax=Brevundimonas phage vB_BpoS-Kikimora TaxID=2948601 RepID=A0A9E7MSY0_9CAUD|nr:putative tail protein [Brevundimonas phage vB_BpoS-Kikimora]
MANTPILDIPQVSPNQNQKETTINTAISILEQATNTSFAIALTGDRTLTKAQFTRAFHLRFSGQPAAAVITLPTTARFFAASNEGSANLTLRSSPTGATVVLAAGDRRLVLSDGADVFFLTA